MKTLLIALMIGLPLVQALAQGQVVKKALSPEAVGTEQLIKNGDLGTLTPTGDGFVGWKGWELGYQVDDQVKHGGPCSARCRNATAEEHRGLTYVVDLNQAVPTPIIAECWSKAEGVSGSADSDYSLYLDLEYMDGTPLWGQIAAFKVGTHDWQRRTVTVIPAKPVRNVSVHGIFRRHAGTAWFADFKLFEMKLPGGVAQFDSVPVSQGGTGVKPVFLPALGARVPAVALYLRDVAAKSDFYQPEGKLVISPDGASATMEATAEPLQLALTYRLQQKDGALRVDGSVRDLSGKDRAVTVYCSMPVAAKGWLWHDDQRVSRRIQAGQKYGNYTGISAGATRSVSKYPLACVSGDREALVIAAPLDMPRLYRFSYDPDWPEFFGAVDLGLAADTHKFPSSASFSFVVYTCDPQWGFRSALQRYYELFPSCFTKRNQREGIWMPFTDIASVAGFEDFGFQFQEGAPNVAFDTEHGIYDFTYVEPASLWVSMPKEIERTNERALAYVKERAAAGDKTCQAALNCAQEDADGAWNGGVIKAPWCDGAFYVLNPSPNVKADDPRAVTKYRDDLAAVLAVAEHPSGVQPGWSNYEKGYELAPGEGRGGSTAAKMTRGAQDPDAGCAQHVTLNQKEPRPLVARVWTKAQDVSGEPDNNYSLYIDLMFTDGTTGWGHLVEAKTGTHDWQALGEAIVPEKPVRALAYHLLLRKPHTGTVWFSDAFLAEQGSDNNLLLNGNFEPATVPTGVKPRLAGTYFDSFEMAAADLNYRREHFAATDTPLVFDGEGRVCQFGMFNTLEYARGIERSMRATGRMTFANGVLWNYPWGAALLDVMGTETNWAPGGTFTPATGWSGASTYTPDDDAIMNYRRALCYQRPYLLLMNTVFDLFKPEWVELYFKRCTAYAVFPGFFSHDASSDVYFSRPALYNRDRPLFKRYIPVIKALSAAGWEPVTWARSENPKVYVERFGKPGGPLYLTLLNDSHQRQKATLTLEAAKLGLPEADDLNVTEALVGGPVIFHGGAATVELAAEDVSVLKLK